MVSKLAISYLLKAQNPHILMLSPPLDMSEKWFSPHLAYTMAKYGMSLCVLGLAGELRGKGVAVNALWPRTTIATRIPDPNLSRIRGKLPNGAPPRKKKRELRPAQARR